MSDMLKVALVGATGLIGQSVKQEIIGRDEIRLTAIARREVPLPRGVRMEMILAPTESWGELLVELKPDSVICALGTTWNKAGKDEAAFRAVDHDLVLNVARAALVAGARQFIMVSSVGASLAAKNFYLRVKGEVERDVAKLGFKRLDILHPGLLRGARADDRRKMERLGIIASPVTNLLLQGKYRKYRAINANDVARAALALTQERQGGRHIHDNEALLRLAKRYAP